MKSGDLVIFQTKDPDNLPLPLWWGLLQMQWIPNRIGAISRAANASTSPWDWDTEDGYSTWSSKITMIKI